MNIEDFKKLGPDAQVLVLILERLEKKVDGLVNGVEHFDEIPST